MSEPLKKLFPDENEMLPKRVIISSGDSKSGPCPVCKAHFGTYEIPFGHTIESELGSDYLPPYHTNCACEVEIEYYKEDESSLSQEQWEEVKSDLDDLSDDYKRERMFGLRASFYRSLGKRVAEKNSIMNKFAETQRSCIQRAEDVKNTFDLYLKAKGIKGVWTEIGQAGLTHAWVEVRCQIEDEDGSMEREVEIYDPWLKLFPLFSPE